MNPKQTVKKAPITTLSAAESLTAFTLTFLAAHHLIGDVNVSTTTQTLAPFIALAIPAVFGVAQWMLVTPWQKARRWAQAAGIDVDGTVRRHDAVAKRQHNTHAAVTRQHDTHAAVTRQHDVVAKRQHNTHAAVTRQHDVVAKRQHDEHVPLSMRAGARPARHRGERATRAIA